MATFNGNVVGGSLALRSSASTGSTRLATIPNGTALTVSTISGNTEWFATSYAGYSGYVVAEFIGITNDGGACTVTTASGSLNIRKKPSGSVIFTAPQNSTLRLLDYTSVSGWYRVSNGEGTGWADSDYLTITAYPGGGSVNPDPDPDPDPDIPVDPEVPSVPAPSVTITATLRNGDTGSQVTALQQRLAELWYYVGDINGIFGYNTEWAVRHFQDRNGLDIDGVVGSNSRAKLNSTNVIRGVDDCIYNYSVGEEPVQWFMNGSDAIWRNEEFDADNTTAVETIADSGNAPTSFAMIAATLKCQAITPAHVCKWLKNEGYRDENGQTGITSSFFNAAATQYGLQYHNKVHTLNDIITQLGYNRLALVRVTGNQAHDYCSPNGATYLVVYAVEDGLVKVLNPNSNTQDQYDMSTSTWNGAEWMHEAHIYGK